MASMFSTPAAPVMPQQPSGPSDYEMQQEREQLRKQEVARQHARGGGVVAGRAITLARRQEQYQAKRAASSTLGV